TDENELLKLLERWRTEAGKAGYKINRTTVAFETGRDGFWLARWLRAHGIEAHVIHAASVAVSREHRRPKTDRLDIRALKRAFLGWLRGERDHCKMAAIPTFAEEDAKRPNREHETLVGERTSIVNRMMSAQPHPPSVASTPCRRGDRVSTTAALRLQTAGNSLKASAQQRSRQVFCRANEAAGMPLRDPQEASQVCVPCGAAIAAARIA